MGIGAWLIYLGNTVTGSIFSGATLVTLVSLFIKNSSVIESSDAKSMPELEKQDNK